MWWYTPYSTSNNICSAKFVQAATMASVNCWDCMHTRLQVEWLSLCFNFGLFFCLDLFREKDLVAKRVTYPRKTILMTHPPIRSECLTTINVNGLFLLWAFEFNACSKHLQLSTTTYNDTQHVCWDCAVYCRLLYIIHYDMLDHLHHMYLSCHCKHMSKIICTHE